MNTRSLNKQFTKYVSQNILGMIGVSVYIIADTFFISVVEGANGITVLNLVLPIYGLLFAIGSMIGIGSATKATLYRVSDNKEYQICFWNGFLWICIISIPFVLGALLCPGRIVALMGGDPSIAALGSGYTRTFLIFTPAFMLNYLFNAFVRNDGNPNKAMLATVGGSLFNIVFDYILMFPLHMGLIGAALATGVSPLLGILICCTHLCSKKCTWKFRISFPSVKLLLQSAALGISAFVGEISSAVITTVFNFLLLSLVGNIAVASYGVVANLALVAVAIFNGITQGAQPLLSTNHGQNKYDHVNYLLKLGLITALASAGVIIVVIYLFTDPIAAIFNSEHSTELARYAHTGLRLYFLGYIFAGCNIVISGFFSAVNLAKQGAITSILRGFIAIIGCACLMAFLFSINGVWLSFPVAEGITLIVGVLLLKRTIRK